MNKIILIVIIFFIIIVLSVLAYFIFTENTIIGPVEIPCGGWEGCNQIGEIVCECEGTSRYKSCGESGIGYNLCNGTCSNCRCYKGPASDGIEVSCDNKNLLRICPDIWYDNKMPSIDGENTVMEYFVLNKERRELSEFDLEWVIDNCQIEKRIVY
ncbi:MAG: hypothetical protein PHV47_02745 [Candidatus Pacebacteria bacterium]|nr:hypothetical protein [Candidatus Paceibacterota bacterium]